MVFSGSLVIGCVLGDTFWADMGDSFETDTMEMGAFEVVVVDCA